MLTYTVEADELADVKRITAHTRVEGKELSGGQTD